MVTCSFCKETFKSEQGVRAHMRWCNRYLTEKCKTVTALGSVPKAAITSAATPPAQSSPPVPAPDLSAPLREFEKAMSGLSTKQEAPPTPQQRLREIVQAAKMQVINHYRTPVGQVTASLRGAAKLAIERELASLPLEELPFEEVLELAEAMRDRLYEPEFRKQAREAERQQAAHEARSRKQIEDLAAGYRAGGERRWTRAAATRSQSVSHCARPVVQRRGRRRTRDRRGAPELDAVGTRLPNDQFRA